MNSILFIVLGTRMSIWLLSLFCHWNICQIWYGCVLRGSIKISIKGQLWWAIFWKQKKSAFACISPSWRGKEKFFEILMENWIFGGKWAWKSRRIFLKQVSLEKLRIFARKKYVLLPIFFLHAHTEKNTHTISHYTTKSRPNYFMIQ